MTRRFSLLGIALAASALFITPAFATSPYTQIGGSLAGYVGQGSVGGAGNAAARNTRPGSAMATGDSVGGIGISSCTTCGTGIQVDGLTQNTATTQTTGRGRAAGNAAGAFQGSVVGARLEGTLSAGRGRR